MQLPPPEGETARDHDERRQMEEDRPTREPRATHGPRLAGARFSARPAGCGWLTRVSQPSGTYRGRHASLVIDICRPSRRSGNNEPGPRVATRSATRPGARSTCTCPRAMTTTRNAVIRPYTCCRGSSGRSRAWKTRTNNLRPTYPEMADELFSSGAAPPLHRRLRGRLDLARRKPVRRLARDRPLSQLSLRGRRLASSTPTTAPWTTRRTAGCRGSPPADSAP